ncbi:YheC/YheD family protein [Salinicoccus sesuvii]|uniref:YheC/YheD family protein n=1 Tax=Salinicoccus sesuvii TaxID=868281 RepID=A0ABV7N6C7_9STAP
MDNFKKDVSYYKSLGIDTEAARFKRYREVGLLDEVDESFVKEVKEYWQKHYHTKVDPVLHIAFMNLTGKKDPRVAFQRIVKNQFIPFFNDQRMKETYRDKNMYDKLIPSDRAVETVLRRAYGSYFDINNSALYKTDVISNLSSYQEDLIVKPSNTNNGRGIKKLNYKENTLFLDDDKVSVEALEKMYGANFAVQKVVQQHPVMAAPHPASVNTLRMVTLRWNNEIKYLLTFARFGANSSVQDNAGAGGVCVGVNENGEFLDTAINEHCEVYTEHPTTGFPFKDMGKIPNFEKFKEYVRELHKEILHHDLVSWDIVVGADGLPVFLEANFSGATWLYQLAAQQPLFGDLTEEVLEYVYKERNDRKSPRRKTATTSRVRSSVNRKPSPVPKTDYKNENMLVGFMQRLDKPTTLAKSVALMSSHYGMEVIYLRPWDVDIEKGTVEGKMYQDGKWVTVERELPRLIDATDPCFKKDTKEIISYLRKNTVLPYDRKNIPNKQRLQEELSKDENFAEYMIPTRTLDDFEALQDFMKEYSTIVIKPLFGERGRGVSILRKQGDAYILGHGTEERELDRDELLQYFKEVWMSEKHLMQKYIKSRTKQGDPFDCRIHVQKNRKGEWVIAKMFIRVGTNQKVMSNVNQGGGISDPKLFLKANFGEGWENIYQNLKNLGEELPHKVEEMKGTPTMDFGFDVAIEESGDLYLIEANRGGTTAPLIAQSAMLRVEYYQHLRETHPKLKNANVKKKPNKVNSKGNDQGSSMNERINQLEAENRRLTKEKEQHKKEYEKITKSNSWRLTVPVRKVSALIKSKKK